MPIIIHTREAEDDTLAILREETGGSVRGVMHCFTGTPRLAEEALALGMHISFAGIVTFPKGANVREVAAIVPADRLLCETDSPYLAPTPHRGQTQRTGVGCTGRRGARRPCEECPWRSCSEQTSANFQTLFRP